MCTTVRYKKHGQDKMRWPLTGAVMLLHVHLSALRPFCLVLTRLVIPLGLHLN